MSETIASLATEFGEDVVVRLGLTDDYANDCRVWVRQFARDHGVTTAAQLGPKPVVSWLAAMGRRGLAPRTIRTRLVAIRAFARWLVETGRLDADPIAHVRGPKCPPVRGPKPIPLAAARVLLSLALRDFTAPDRRRARFAPAKFACYAMLVFTGLRIGELQAQRWRDVSMEQRLLDVTKGKGRRPRTIGLCDELISVLHWWRHVCPSTVLVCPTIPCHRTLERDFIRAGLPRECGDWHRLRKTAITARADAGAHVWDLADFAGHSDPAVTLRHYVATAEARKLAVANMLPQLLPSGNIFRETS